MTLKEHFLKEPKEEVYGFYLKLFSKPKEYTQISRKEIYEEVIKSYKKEPEIILELCTIEEIEVLKKLMNEEKIQDEYGYLEYCVNNNLLNNFLILKKDNSYYIPSDIKNYIKMALNLYDEKKYSFRDVTNSVIIGLVRINNVILINDFLNMLAKHFINMTKENLKKYIKANPMLINKIKIVKYHGEEYITSLEHPFYKDILALRKDYIKYKDYKLEEVISIGKYKINLFKEEVLKFLSFLESHLKPYYIDLIINELVLYSGFDINDEKTLIAISDNINELLEEIKKVLIHFPMWIYQGNDAISLKGNIILPAKNELCFCGSGKKFKHCCWKLFK